MTSTTRRSGWEGRDGRAAGGNWGAEGEPQCARGSSGGRAGPRPHNSAPVTRHTAATCLTAQQLSVVSCVRASVCVLGHVTRGLVQGGVGVTIPEHAHPWGRRPVPGLLTGQPVSPGASSALGGVQGRKLWGEEKISLCTHFPFVSQNVPAGLGAK